MILLSTLIAACDPNDPNNVIGCLNAPTGVQALPVGPGGVVSLGPIINLLNLVFKLVFIVGGIYGLFNVIVAGYGFMSAGGDAKMVTAAWNRIQQTFMGVVIMVASFLLAAIIGRIIFGDATYFLKPSLSLSP